MELNKSHQYAISEQINPLTYNHIITIERLIVPDLPKGFSIRPPSILSTPPPPHAHRVLD